jgi:nitroimidazol reductase NimA-like FMN-containing flavoprotein (pyridoxamine 5'-phosphate oxidase superfamily)
LADTEEDRQQKRVRRAIQRGSFCMLATSSAANVPHEIGVLYVEVERMLYVSTLRSSVKARNVLANGSVAICVPVRRIPIGPPFHVAFQGRAEVCSREDPRLVRLLEAKRLKPITSHGELEHPDSVFLIVTPGPTVASYGLGVPLRRLLRDPILGSRSVELR